MTPCPSERPTPALWAGCAAVGLFLILAARFWHPVFGFTRLLQFDREYEAVRIPAVRDLPIFIYEGNEGYDGMAYAQIACSPALGDPDLKPAIDNLSYRARRILLPALAWVAGTGRPTGILSAYCWANLLIWIGAAVLFWRLLDVRDARSWLAWAGIMGSAGALCSVRFALTDLASGTLAAAALWVAESSRKAWAIPLAAAAGLARETALLAVPALARRRPRSWVLACLAAAPLAAWLLFIRLRLGPASQGWGNFDWPLRGWAEQAVALSRACAHPKTQWVEVTSLLAFAGLCVQATYLLVKPEPRNPWWRLGGAFLILAAFLGHAVWEGFPGASMRVLFPMGITFNVLAARRKAAWLWLVAGNLSVPAGVFALANLAPDPSEMAAVGSGDWAYVVRAQPGWYGLERDARHLWNWSAGEGRLRVDTWPGLDGRIRLDAALFSRDRRRVLIRQGENVLASVELAGGPARVSVEASAKSGSADLELSSIVPPVREGPWPEARMLSFALYDPRVTVLPGARPSPRP